MITEHRQSFIHWLLFTGSLAFISLACGLGMAKELKIGSTEVTKTNGMEMVYGTGRRIFDGFNR